MRRAKLIMVSFAIACEVRRPGAQAQVDVPVSAHGALPVVVPPAPSATTEYIPRVRRLGLQEALCAGRTDCVVKTAFAGAPGKDGDGRSVVLVLTKLSVSGGDEAPRECQGNEIWLVRSDGEGRLVDRQLVAEGCTEDTPFGVACDGLMMAHVEPPKIAAPQTAIVSWQSPGPGCGGWTRGSGEIEVELDTFAVVRRSEWSDRAREPNDSHSVDWDFKGWSFKSEWQTSDGDCPSRKRGPAFGIPKLALGSAFLDGAWQTANLEQCATTIDANHGVALPGTSKSTAVLRAVVSETDALFVDVVDVIEGQRRTRGELQICFDAWSTHSYDYCHMPASPDCVRVALDGRLRAGKTKIERAPDRPRFRVQLPPDTTALSVILVEPGPRTIGSSAYLRGDATSLANIFALGAEVATCHLDGDHLQRTIPPHRSDRASIDATGL